MTGSDVEYSRKDFTGYRDDGLARQLRCTRMWKGSATMLAKLASRCFETIQIGCSLRGVILIRRGGGDVT